MALGYSVPGVYYQPQPRAPEVVLVRTDVAGFAGFDPRLRDGTTPSQLSGLPPVGHSFQIDVTDFQVSVGNVRAQLPATVDFALSRDPATIPISLGQSIVYALVAVVKSARLELVSVPGTAATSGNELPPADSTIAAAVTPPGKPTPDWLRIADVTVSRNPLIRVRFRHDLPMLAACEDWNDFRFAFGTPVDDGTFLGRGVRSYFANGAKRCWVAVISRPDYGDAADLERARADLIGMQGQSEVQATGLERLLLIEEVSFVDLPDLYARRVAAEPATAPLPPVDQSACFEPCDRIRTSPGAISTGQVTPMAPLYSDAQVIDAQRQMLIRCFPERWRVLVLLAAPLELDTTDSRYHGPTNPRALDWRQQFVGLGDDLELSCGAFYHPWLLDQERVDATPVEVPPLAAAAGIIARRDLARGPHVSPANETLRGVVGLTRPIDDLDNGRLYDVSINVIRPFPGFGIQVWGARTLSPDRWLRFLAVRRCLSAIERRAAVTLERMVFEPNTPLLWLQVTQAMLGILLPLHDSGALRGDEPEQSFYVRCDRNVNPPEEILAGRLLCEVGVAVAAPAEFIVFRVGRLQGTVEVTE